MADNRGIIGTGPGTGRLEQDLAAILGAPPPRAPLRSRRRAWMIAWPVGILLIVAIAATTGRLDLGPLTGGRERPEGVADGSGPPAPGGYLARPEAGPARAPAPPAPVPQAAPLGVAARPGTRREIGREPAAQPIQTVRQQRLAAPAAGGTEAGTKEEEDHDAALEKRSLDEKERARQARLEAIDSVRALRLR